MYDCSRTPGYRSDHRLQITDNRSQTTGPASLRPLHAFSYLLSLFSSIHKLQTTSHKLKGPPLLEGGLLNRRCSIAAPAIPSSGRRQTTTPAPRASGAALGHKCECLHARSLGPRWPSPRQAGSESSLTTPATSTGLAAGFGPRVTLSGYGLRYSPQLRVPRSRRSGIRRLALQPLHLDYPHFL